MICSERVYKGIKMGNILNNLWVVTFTCAESINSTTVQGPFESREVAEKFADIWNKKRDEYIDKTIDEDPEGDYEFNYIKAISASLIQVIKHWNCNIFEVVFK